MHLPFNKLPLSYSKFFFLILATSVCPAVSTDTQNQIHVIYCCGFCLWQSDELNVCMLMIHCIRVCVMVLFVQ